MVSGNCPGKTSASHLDGWQVSPDRIRDEDVAVLDASVLPSPECIHSQPVRCSREKRAEIVQDNRLTDLQYLAHLKIDFDRPD